VLFVETERAADLAFKTADGTAFDRRSLQHVKLLANSLDQVARPAEIDGMLLAVFAVAKAIVGPEGSAVTTAPSGGDMAVTGEKLGPQCKQAEGGVIELVSRGLDFHFRGRPRF
jgi:hypothetical protein